MSFRESEAVRTEYAQTKCKTDRRAACLGKRLFEFVRLGESRRRTTVGEKLRTLRACFAPGGRSRHSARVSTFRKNKFELLESCAMDEHFEHLKYLIKNGVNAIMPRV